MLWAGLPLLANAKPPGNTPPSPQARETHRIRIVNRSGGTVGISLDGGRQYTEVARVLHPATAAMNSFAAIAGAAPGTVAAITVEHWLMRVDATEPASAPPRVMGICARGARAGEAFTELDLPPAAAVFTTFAPMLGSRAFVERQGALSALGAGYRPRDGDTWVIVAELATQLPAEVLFENKPDGAVTAVGRDGAVKRIGRVKKPIRGVGRYPGTTAVEPGRVASQHPGAILVGTAAAGSGEAAASGFLVQSAAFTESDGADAPSALVVEPLDNGPLSLFRLPMPFRGVGTRTVFDQRYAGKAWEAVPQREAADASAFTDAEGVAVERLRLRIGGMTREELAAALKRSARSTSVTKPAAGSAASAKQPVYKGRLTISANVTGRGIQLVKFLLDGQVRAIDNVYPYAWDWDTRTSTNGEHTIEIQGMDLDGKLINTTTSRVTVAN